jgi:glycosyltransferase domain-containing protein
MIEMNKNLSRITLIVPTIARPDFVRRQFVFWSQYPVQVVVLDGAKTPVDLGGLPKVAPNVRYELTGTHFNSRLATAEKYIDTEFCAFLPDDEFFLPSGLSAAVSHLDANSQTIGVVGRALYFFVDQSRFLVTDAYREWKSFPAEATTPRQRLDLDVAPNKTHKVLFGLFRKEPWISIFSDAFGTYYSTGYAYERLANLKSVALGRTDLIEHLIWMRSMENPPISNESVPRLGSQDFVPWATEGRYPDEVAHYRAKALRILKDAGRLDDEEAAYFEKRFFHAGIDRQVAKVARNNRSISKRFRRLLIQFGPGFVKRFAKRHVPNRFLKFTDWSGVELAIMCKSLRDRGTDFNLVELERIKTLSLALDAEIMQSRNR